MARVKISEPDKYLFDFQLRVRVTDLNYGNHLANDKILSYAQEARIRFLEHHNASELDFFGVSLIQGDAEILYQSEGFLGNEIEISIGASDVSNSSFDFIYKMTNKSTNKALALVKTRMVCFDYDDRKVKSVPESFRQMVVS